MELVLHDVAFGIEIGKNVDGRVGDEERFGICRHIQDEDVADPPRRAQAGLARRHLAHELVRVQAALHQQLALGLVDQLDGLRRCGFAVGHIDDLEASIARRCSRATALIFAAGPTRIGLMMPASAASMGPRSAVSSQGRTTTVVAAGTCLARAISRSYFEWGGSPSGPIAAMLPMSPSSNMTSSITQTPSPRGDASHDALACASFRVDAITVRFGTVVDASSTPNARAIRSMRSLSSAENSPRALMICLMSSYALRRVSASAGSIEGRAASAASVSISRR